MKKVLLVFLFMINKVHADELQSMHVLSQFENKDCLISFIGNNDNHCKFVVKQIKSADLDEQFLLVLDALGCFIAESINLPVNKVRIIHRDCCVPGKVLSDRPATVHTFIPGVATSDPSCYFYNLDVHQRYQSLWQNQMQLSNDEIGLTETVIRNMALHQDLPSLVALDTFTANADRSQPNLFYDQKSNTFWGIDMADVFNKNLAKKAFEQLDDMINNKKISFDDKELFALKEYCTCLQKLLSLHTPETINAMLENSIQQAGFDSSEETVKNRLFFHKKFIIKNYRYIQKLVDFINDSLLLSS